MDVRRGARSRSSRRSSCSTARRRNADGGLPPRYETAVAKFAANEAGFARRRLAVQAMGAIGSSEESLVEYCFRRTRGWKIAGGSTEILKNRIAETSSTGDSASGRASGVSEATGEVTDEFRSRERLYHALVRPATVAIVGASDDPAKPPSRPLHNLADNAWAGTVYVVNPNRDSVGGHRAYHAIADVPTVPDHVFVLTGADLAIEAARECARMGVGVVTIMADGFSGGSSESRRRLAALEEITAGGQLESSVPAVWGW